MSVVALTSAKGSPGVTTLAHRLAEVLARREQEARRPPRHVVVVEGDPAGGDLAARRGLAGAPGLASLALSARRSLSAETVLAHCQQLGPVEVLAGVAGCRQGAVVAPVLPKVLEVLGEAGTLVILDAGRLGPPPPAGEPSIFQAADEVALVTRTGADCVVHVRSAVDSLRALGVRPELILVGRPEYPPAMIASACGAPVLGVVADSSAEAAIDPRRSLRGRRGELARSVEAIASTLLSRLDGRATGQGVAAGPATQVAMSHSAPGRQSTVTRLRPLPAEAIVEVGSA